MDVKRYIDISPPVCPKLAVWPGDVPFQRALALDTARGDHLTLSSITTTLHLGAHADAPSHFIPLPQPNIDTSTPSKGKKPKNLQDLTIDLLDLSAYMGPCLVIDVPVQRGDLITPTMLEPFTEMVKQAKSRYRLSEIPRLLCKTRTYPDYEHFNEDFAAFHPDAIRWLGSLGLLLIGIDTPSIDAFDSKTMESHHLLHQYGMRNLEGLDLSQVEPGAYELIALPLRLVGCDGSPVRAILRPL